MSDEHSTRAPEGDAAPRRRDHLRLVPEAEPLVAGPMTPVVGPGAVPPVRPRSIGRLIAQTAMMADTAVQRRRAERPQDATRAKAGRLLGRFR